MAIVGKCSLMCPMHERIRREKEKRLHVLEISNSKFVSPQTTERLAVKEFVRSAAGCDLAREEWLRPPLVLSATVDHLISLTDRNDLPWWKIYDFVDNRIQSVRQDLTIQASEGTEAIDILEKCNRFYLYSQYRLRLQCDKFDAKLNSDHLGHCLIRLTELYAKSLTVHRNEAEMMTYYMLYKMGGSHDTIMRILSSKHLRDHVTIRRAIKMNKLSLTQNFVKFFKELKQLSPLGQCSLLVHLDDMKRDALKVLANAYGVSNAVLPLCIVSSWLGFNTTDHASQLIRSQGVQVVSDNVVMKKSHQHKTTSGPMTCQYHVISELDEEHMPSSLLININ